MKNLLKFCAAFAGLAAAGVVYAQPTNGDFSSGLAGWSTFGDASMQSGGAFVTTASLLDDDSPAVAGEFNYSGTAADDDTTNSLAPALGLAAGGLDPDPVNGLFAQEGSAISQSFNVAVGDVIVFNWRLYTNDVGVQTNPDYAFVVIAGNRFTIGTSADATNPSLFPSGLGNTNFLRETNLNTFTSAPFAASGLITLAFTVVDVDGFDTTSALFIDDVTVIPEPSVLGLGVLAAVGAILMKRRRR
jgi:hypothetical protein